MRVTYTQIEAAGIRINAVAEDVSVYDFYTPPGTNNTIPFENLEIPDTRLELIDTAAFPADDPQRGILRFAGAGLAENWNGAVLYRSDDGGSNYYRIADIASAAIIGTVIDALPIGTTHVFDESSDVTVVVLGGELQSVTTQAVLNGANAVIIGNEIIQFRTALLVEPGKYQLSGLLRGRLGTEWAVSTHIAGERFVFLDGRVGRFTMPNGLIGQSRGYKPVSVGDTLSGTANRDFTYSAAALRPYSPVHIAGERNVAGDLTIRWTRRTRQGGDWLDGVDVPLNETQEAYEVEIMNGLSVVRSLSSITSPSVIYTAAMQVADFGSNQATVSVRVYQISEAVGRGYPGSATV
jgi:hypothetical protein